MADPSRATQPPGVLATIVGGIAGTATVYLIGPPIANAVAADDLAGIGTALLVLFGLWCVGTGLGVGIALAVRRHQRAIVTGTLAIPGMFIAAMFTIFASRFTPSEWVGWPLLLGLSVVLLWLARVIAMASNGPEASDD